MQTQTAGVPKPALLHVGCGRIPLPDYLAGYSETRLDIDDAAEPDIVADMTDLGDIGPYQVVFSSHALEHLAYHDVGKALSEFLRVLLPGGNLLVFTPDLEDVRPTEETLYESEAGPVAGLDMYFGMRSMLVDYPYMAHKTGFIAETLENHLKSAGFREVAVTRMQSQLQLMGVALK